MGSNPEHESPGTVKKICPNCGEPFLRWRANALQTGAKFCSNRCANTGENSHMWKDKPVYSSLHKWIYRHKKRNGKCSNCGKTGKTQWANTNGEYKRVLEDFVELCVKCHVHFDIANRGGFIVNQAGKQFLRKTTKLINIIL